MLTGVEGSLEVADCSKEGIGQDIEQPKPHAAHWKASVVVEVEMHIPYGQAIPPRDMGLIAAQCVRDQLRWRTFVERVEGSEVHVKLPDVRLETYVRTDVEGGN
jgi:hypothetical protein